MKSSRDGQTATTTEAATWQTMIGFRVSLRRPEVLIEPMGNRAWKIWCKARNTRVSHYGELWKINSMSGMDFLTQPVEYFQA